jgi:pimeloyl-ACP methyl ester carboxylesterase
MAEPIELLAEDGVRIAAEVERAGRYYVVLVHDLGADLDSLAPLASGLSRDSFSVVGFDFRGHGLSDGSWDAAKARLDVRAAAAWARSDGAGQVFAVGAGTGACALLDAASAGLIDAAVLLGPAAGPGCEAGRARRWVGPKLFIAGSADPEGLAAARRVFDSCIGPRLFVQLPTPARAHALLTSACAAQALSHAVGYLAQNRVQLDPVA